MGVLPDTSNHCDIHHFKKIKTPHPEDENNCHTVLGQQGGLGISWVVVEDVGLVKGVHTTLEIHEGTLQYVF